MLLVLLASLAAAAQSAPVLPDGAASARALHAAEEANDSKAIAAAFEALEDSYYRQSRYDLVLAEANRMLQRPNDPNRALYLEQRGLASADLDQPDQAWQALERALPLAEANGDVKVAGLIHRDRGMVLWHFRHDKPRALAEYDQALALGRRAHAWFLVTSTLHMSGSIFRTGPDMNLPEALRRYEEALQIAKRERTGTTHILKNMAEVYAQMGDRPHAEAALEEAVRIADRFNIAEIRWQARNQLAILLRDSDHARADRYFSEALDLLDHRQSDVLLEDFRPGVMATAIAFSNPYDAYIDFLLDRQRTGDAFIVAERERARAFLETLSASREVLSREVSRQYADAERRLLQRIRTAQALLRTDTLTDAKRRELVPDVARSESELSDLRLQLAVEHPSIAHARYPKMYSIAELQRSFLRNEETMVTFYVGSRRSVAWVITRSAVKTILLPAGSQIAAASLAATDELRNPLAHGDSARALSRLLAVDAIESAADGTTLIVVPHAALYGVPFEALVDAAGHPLIERFAISYAPSASSLAFLRSARPRIAGPVTLLAVANPIVAGGQSATTRQVDLAHINALSAVPRSADEAHAIAALFGAAAHVLDGAHATRSEVMAASLAQMRIVHFATHALIDETRPDRSALVLTANPPRDDGLLQVRDIYSMHLAADLVTLSACETALGQRVQGEGIVGLSRAFFFAGARNVVASLWDVDDESTARLMTYFYANLQKGQPIDVALRSAKLTFIRSSASSRAPFYWAAFIVNGDARSAVNAPPRANFFAPAIAALSALFAIAAVLYWRIVKTRGLELPTARP